MSITTRVAALYLVAGCAALAAQQPPAQQPQTTFRAAVEVTSLDVSVVDDKGKPIRELTPADFTVRIDGTPRKIVSAEWVALATEGDGNTAEPPPEGYSSNASSVGGRLIVMAIDEPNIRFGGAAGIRKAADAFIDRLHPGDRIAVAGFGLGSPATVFTADRERVKKTIARMAGQKRAGSIVDVGKNIAFVEAQAIARNDRTTFEMVVMRECQGLERSPGAMEQCRMQIDMQARSVIQDATIDADQTMNSLRHLFAGLAQIDAPKTMVLISEGFAIHDEALLIDLGSMAAQARTSIYALKLDNAIFDISDGRMPISPFQDRQARAEGLDLLAGAARGTLFTVTGTGQALFERIESELSGYYLLGVESDPKDTDGKTHPVKVDVSKRGAIVRSRRQIAHAKSDRPGARTARQAVAAAMSSPLLSSALPLRVASFSLQGPERDRVQLLIHADIGTDYPASRPMAVSYVITDKDGVQIDTKTEVTRLPPVMAGVPAALPYTAGASLAPGDYTIKLAVADGERVGSIEHPIHAGLTEAGGVRLSALMVGGPTEVGELLKPTIGHDVTFGSVHGYIEAYGATASGLTMEYEIATAPDAPALVNTDVAAKPGGGERVIFTKVMPVHALPPGPYVLRAILSADGRSIKTVTRPFVVAPPKVLMTSADGLGATSVDAELFLPVDDTTLSPPFSKDAAIARETIELFADHLESAARPAFDQGVAFLAAGDYTKAEQSFKKGISPDTDSAGPMAYLAVAFAASGHDDAAASAWQTALVDGEDLPQIYEWLAGALLRNHAYPEARAVLEEASGKWPADRRFMKPLAMLYATFGRGREAVRTMARYLADNRDDVPAYYLAVEWLYTVRSAGAVVTSRAEDLQLARTWSDAYSKGRGPNVALVKQWVDYLEKER